MNEKISRIVQEVLELAAKPDAAPHAIHKRGLDAKQAIWDEYDQMQLAVNILDGVVPYKVVGLPWKMGWVNPSAPVTEADLAASSTALAGRQPPAKEPARPSVVRDNRIRRVLTLAQEALAAGRTMMTTDEIARVLQNEGDSTAIRSLHTAVGNILNRTGKWKRVETGLYKYTETLE